MAGKAQLKTRKTTASVAGFLATVKDEQRRADCQELVAMMEAATGAKAKLWGTSIVGFGEQRLVYESGRELDWMKLGFSPRKQALTLYLHLDPALLKKLGTFTTGKGCLYLKALADVDRAVLRKLIAAAAR